MAIVKKTTLILRLSYLLPDLSSSYKDADFWS